MKLPPMLINKPFIDGVFKKVPVPNVSIACPFELFVAVPSPTYKFACGVCAITKGAPASTPKHTASVLLVSFNIMGLYFPDFDRISAITPQTRNLVKRVSPLVQSYVKPFTEPLRTSVTWEADNHADERNAGCCEGPCAKLPGIDQRACYYRRDDLGD